MPETLSPDKPQILALFESWTDGQKKMAVSAMSLAKKAELEHALRAAGWSPSDFIAAGWSPSALIAAGWSPSALIAAGWSPSALRAAGWSPSALIAAGWSPSALIAAGWSPSDFIAAGWSPSDFNDIEANCKKDVQAKARRMGRKEAQFVAEQLQLGLLYGSSYGTVESCGCFIGSAARAAGKSVAAFCAEHKIKQDGSSPAEQWFMGVTIGDTPENNYAAQKGVEWIEEVLAE